jgi:hypothetical protein
MDARVASAHDESELAKTGMSGGAQAASGTAGGPIRADGEVRPPRRSNRACSAPTAC